MTTASITFEKLLAESDENGDIEQMRDLLVTYDIASKDMNRFLEIDFSFWRQRFRNQILSHIDYVRRNDSWQRSIKTMSKRFPELKDILQSKNSEA